MSNILMCNEGDDFVCRAFHLIVPGKGSFVFPVHPEKESRASSIALGYGLKSKAMFICILLGLVRGTNMTFIFLKRLVNCHVRPKS